MQAQGVALSLSSGSASPGGSVQLNISLEASGDLPTSAQWTLNYSTTDFTSAMVAAGSGVANKTLSCISGTGTATCLVWGLNTSSIPNNLVASVTLTLAKSTQDTSSLVTLTNDVSADSTGAAIPTTASSGTVTILQTPPPIAPTSATFTALDTATQGTWTGTYGSNGYSIANDTNKTVPSYATLSFTGDAQYTWSTTTTSTSALQVLSGSSSRIASCYYSATSFNINLNLTDGNTHQIALYLLDDQNGGTGRAETVSILNASTNAVLTSESFSSFQNGEYAVWNVSGNVIIRVTRTTGVNAVVSGIFFDPVATLLVPNLAGDTLSAATTAIQSAGLVVGTVATASSSTVPSGDVISESPAAGTLVSSGSTVNLVVSLGPVTPKATYIRLDTTTLGTWTGKYGSNGYSIANDTNKTVPSYATLSFTGDAQYTWSTTTTSTSALQVLSGSSSRIASCYYSATSFNINLNLTDGNTHQIALYLLDDQNGGTGRAETVSILNASTNAVLTSESFSSFQNGEYAVWNISGNVIIRVTRTTGVNAVVSGIFFDPVATVLVPNLAGDTLSAATTAIQSAGLVVGTVATASSSTVASGDVISESPAAGTLVSSGSAVNLVVSLGPVTPKATYTGLDTTTLGTWTGKYGSSGYSIANDTNKTVPSYATLSFTGDAQYTWSTTTTSTSALQVLSGSSSRIASCYYSATSFNINLNLTDGNTHQIALYLLDDENGGTGRAETISILNASTNAVLTSESFSSFQNGEYAIWNVSGNVIDSGNQDHRSKRRGQRYLL